MFTHHWLVLYLLFWGIGTVLCLTLLYGSRPWMLRWLGQRPFCSPNWMSLWRIPWIWAGQVIFLTAQGDVALLMIGFLLTASGLMLDRLDGKMAKVLTASLKRLRYLESHSGNLKVTIHWPEDKGAGMTDSNQLWAWFEEEYDQDGLTKKRLVKVVLEAWVWRLMSPYTRLPMFKVVVDEQSTFGDRRLVLTGIGEWLDPLVDKFNFLPMFAFLAYQGHVNVVVTSLVILLDLTSTILREPFKGLYGFRRLQKFVREAKATWVGKSKVIFQILTLLTSMPTLAGWLNQRENTYSYWLNSGVLLLAALIGLGSILSRLTFREWLISSRSGQRLYGRFRKLFDHDIDELG